jgi:hypothetical protein
VIIDRALRDEGTSMGQTGDDFEKGEADGTTDALAVLRTIINACSNWSF